MMHLFYQGSIMRHFVSIAAICAILSGVPVSAQDLSQDATVFGARQTVSDVAISPSGNKLLYVSPGDSSDETIYLVDLAGDATPKPILVSNESNARLDGCAWGNEERIVCTLYGIEKSGTRLLYFTRAFSVTDDGQNGTLLSPSGPESRSIQDGGRFVAIDVEGEPRSVLMTRAYREGDSTNTRLYNRSAGLGVELIDLYNGKGKQVERPNAMADDYIADEKGAVRIMAVSDRSGGIDGSDMRYLYRAKGSDKWLPLSTADASNSLVEGFIPVAVDSAKNVVYGFERVDGYRALFSIALDGSMKKTLIKSRDDVDVDGLVRVGRSGRVIGVSYATDKRYVEYFDPFYESLAKGLRAALPGQPAISILDANADESAIVLAASSDTDPGMVYLYEKDGGSLGELFPLRDPLVGRAMGEMKAVSYPASDGTQIPGYLTLPYGSDGKNLPAIVMPHGGPGARDEWGFDWLVQFFAARGYAVMQPNYRGSAGYGDAWFGRNGVQAWDTAIGDVNDAGKWLVAQGIADASKLGIVGWSYGGYAGLQSQVVDSDLFKAVVAIAPVTDFGMLREENRNYTSFQYYDRFIGNGPHVDAGSPARHAEYFKAPVLLVHGTMDLNVGVAHSKLMEQRLKSAGKQVDYLEFDGLDHSLVHSQARRIMLKRIGEFLDSSM